MWDGCTVMKGWCYLAGMCRWWISVDGGSATKVQMGCRGWMNGGEVGNGEGVDDGRGRSQ